MIIISPRLSCFLDTARWLAAAAVVCEHLRALLLGDWEPGSVGVTWKCVYFFSGFGQAAVLIFFVLSGFLIGGEVFRQISGGTFDWRDYAIRRFSRIYPVYLAALVLGGGFDWLGLHYFNATGLYTGLHPFPSMNFSVMERLSGTHFVQNLAFLQEIKGPAFGSNQPLWSLAYEAWYYAIFPLALWPVLSRKASPMLRTAAACVALVCAWFVGPVIMAYLILWMIGLLPHFWSERWRFSGLHAGAALVTALLVVRLRAGGESWAYVRDLSLGLAFAACIYRCGQSRAPAPAGARFHHTLAGFSYSLYLIHWPLLLLLIAFLTDRCGLAVLRTQPGAGVVLRWIGLFLTTYLCAYAVAWATEHRTPQLRAWLRSRFQAKGATPSTLRS